MLCRTEHTEAMRSKWAKWYNLSKFSADFHDTVFIFLILAQFVFCETMLISRFKLNPYLEDTWKEWPHIWHDDASWYTYYLLPESISQDWSVVDSGSPTVYPPYQPILEALGCGWRTKAAVQIMGWFTKISVDQYLGQHKGPFSHSEKMMILHDNWYQCIPYSGVDVGHNFRTWHTATVIQKSFSGMPLLI